MRITLSRMILLSGLLHTSLAVAAVTAKFPGHARIPSPPSVQVKLVRRAEVPKLKLPEPREEPQRKNAPEPILERKKAPVLEARNEIPVEKKKPEMVPLPQEIEVDMTLARDLPTPKVQTVMNPEQPKSAGRIRAADIDLNLEIAGKTQPSAAPQDSNQGVPSSHAIVSNAGAGYVSMAMDIAPEKSARPGAGEGKNPGVSTGRSILGLAAKAHAATLDTVSMSLDIQQGGGKGMKPSAGAQQTAAKGEGRPARVLSIGGQGLGGIELGSGLFPKEGSGKPAVASANASSQLGTPGAKMILRHAEGQIPLGAPLAFRLADVGDETNSGSAYLARSTQLKKLLDGQRLPSAPVTVPVSTVDSQAQRGDRLVGVSYSRTQIVLQYASGKQQVITLAPDEPYPRFELRLASNGSQNVAVGSKLEEITTCLQTLQHVLKE